MEVANAPTSFPIPFANSAGAGYIRTIPQASQISVTPGAASLTDGFPPLNFLPVSAGGVPPFGQDMNGVLYETTLAVQWLQAGYTGPYNNTFSTAIGGYPSGAILMKASLDGLWISAVDNNATNPDAGGTGWNDLTAGRLLNIQIFTSSGTYTETPGTNKVIVKAQGAGAGGGGVAAQASGSSGCGGAGGAGAYAEVLITSGFSGATVTVGAAGTGGTAGNNPGTAGGASSFGSFVSCPGGNAGAAGQSSSTPGFAGSNAGSSAPTIGSVAATLVAKRGESSGWGLIGMNSGNGTGNAPGASSPLGTGGIQISTVGPSSAGTPAQGYGSSGSGAVSGSGGTSAAGGAGAPGIVIVWEFA